MVSIAARSPALAAKAARNRNATDAAARMRSAARPCVGVRLSAREMAALRRRRKTWRARHDSNVRPLPSEGSTLIQLSYGRVSP
jgi:hypothetical protein